MWLYQSEAFICHSPRSQPMRERFRQVEMYRNGLGFKDGAPIEMKHFIYVIYLTCVVYVIVFVPSFVLFFLFLFFF